MSKQDPEGFNELGNLLTGIAVLADTERASSQGYKNLFKGSADMESLLRQTENQMTDAMLNATKVLKDKFGYEHTPDDVWWILAALPFLRGKLVEHIKQTQGSSCCVDKAFYHLAEVIEDKFRQEKPS